jgi:hypothetical protein
MTKGSESINIENGNVSPTITANSAKAHAPIVAQPYTLDFGRMADRIYMHPHTAAEAAWAEKQAYIALPVTLLTVVKQRVRTA